MLVDVRLLRLTLRDAWTDDAITALQGQEIHFEDRVAKVNRVWRVNEWVMARLDIAGDRVTIEDPWAPDPYGPVGHLPFAPAIEDDETP